MVFWNSNINGFSKFEIIEVVKKIEPVRLYD